MKFGINELVNGEFKKVGVSFKNSKKKLPHQMKKYPKEYPKVHPKIWQKKMEDNLSPIQNFDESDEI